MLVRTITRHPCKVLLLLMLAAVFPGCSPKHYRRSADREVYGIINEVESAIFGTNTGFNIDTRYSSRDWRTVWARDVLDDRTATNRRVLNLEDALELAFQNSREYQAQKEQLYLTALTLTGTRHEFSPQFFANSTVQMTGITGEGQRDWTLRNRIGVNQLLDTGGSLSAALANDILTFYTGNRPREILSVISVDLTQPLLRGFGRNSPLVEQLTQDQRDVVYAVRSYNRYQQQFAVDVVDAYFSLLTQKDIVRNNYRNYTNRVETTRYLEARAVDRERKSNVDDARTAELTARRDYINSLASHLNALDAFKLRLGIPISEQIFLDDIDLRNLIHQGLIPVEIGPRAAYQTALQHQVEILNAVDRFEDARRKVRISADLLKPGLNLFSSVSGDSEFPADYTDFDIDQVRYSVGARLDLPLDRKNERNSYRATLIAFESQLRALSLTLDNYKDRIDRGLRTLEQARLNYLNGLEALRVAERRVENNTMLLEAGRATIRDLREAQDSLIFAQNALSTLYTSYLSARLNLLLNMGLLNTVPNEFWLQDPLKNLLGPSQVGAPALRMPDNAVVPPENFLDPEL